MVLSKKRARKVLEEIIALFPDAKPSLDLPIILNSWLRSCYQLRRRMQR